MQAAKKKGTIEKGCIRLLLNAHPSQLAFEEGGVKEKFYLTYPPPLIKEPMLYLLGKKFDIVTNIRGANISNDMGLLALELEGSQQEIDRAVSWLRNQGITVEPIEKNVIE